MRIGTAQSVSSGLFSQPDRAIMTALSSPLLTYHEAHAQPSQPFSATAQPPLELSPETVQGIREALLSLTTFESVAGVAGVSAAVEADPSPAPELTAAWSQALASAVPTSKTASVSVT